MEKLKKILIIDDDPHFLLGLSELFSDEGYLVMTARDGMEGIRLARSNHPDLILCDVSLPEVDGFEVRQVLGDDLILGKIPFVFLSGRTSHADLLAGLTQGADDYITKPFDVDELLLRTRALLKRADPQQDGHCTEITSQDRSELDLILTKISHEMRTPLGIILSSLELCLSDGSDQLSDFRRELLESASASSHRLHSLTEDLIFLIEMEFGKTEIFHQLINLDLDLKNPMHYVLVRWCDKNLKLHIKIAPDVRIHSSRHKFRHVIQHLVDNACKYSPPQSCVTVNVEANGPGGCRMTVCDEGPGIPPQYHELVFDRFFQVPNADGSIPTGLGIGLTIARTFARLSGGDVTILDTPTGCKVQFTLPPERMDWE